MEYNLISAVEDDDFLSFTRNFNDSNRYDTKRGFFKFSPETQSKLFKYNFKYIYYMVWDKIHKFDKYSICFGKIYYNCDIFISFNQNENKIYIENSITKCIYSKFLSKLIDSYYKNIIFIGSELRLYFPYIDRI